MTRQELVATTAKMLKAKKSQTEIAQFLQQNGINLNDFHSFIQEAKNYKLIGNDLKGRLVAAGAVILTIIVFIKFIPFSIYVNNATLLHVIGALLVTFCIGRAIGNLSYWQKLEFKPALFLLIPAIVMYFVFSTVFDSKSYSELRKNGVITRAVIASGKKSTSSKSSSYEVDLEYDVANSVVRKTVSLSSIEYDKMYLNKNLFVVYLPKHPHITGVVTDAYSLAKYTNKIFKKLTFKQLTSLMDLDLANQALKLNTMSFGWSFTVADSMFINGISDEQMIINAESLRLIDTDYKRFQFWEKEIIESGMKALQKDEAGVQIYLGEKYLAQSSCGTGGLGIFNSQLYVRKISK